jgi:rod shape-determining protein MreD
MIGSRFFSHVLGLTANRRAAAQRSRLNRTPSQILVYLTPWLSIAMASVAPGWPLIASFPLMPPLGFLMLLCWRQLHPGLLPVWAGVPLGLFDDLVSGQPVGSGVLLWSIAMLALEAVELRWPWRNYLVEWSVSSITIAAYLVMAGVIASGIAKPEWLIVIGLQVAVSILVYPLVGRLVAWLDRVRLTPIRDIGQ